MSFVTARPGLLASATGDLQSFGSATAQGNAAVAGPATEAVPATADEMSRLNAAHTHMYEAIGA
jgi:hypothetical protein